MTRRLLTLSLAFALLAAPASHLAAKEKGSRVDPTELKIRRMAEALAARDRADYPAALAILAELHAANPADLQISSIIAQIRELQARPAKPQPPTAPLPDPRESASPGAEAVHQGDSSSVGSADAADTPSGSASSSRSAVAPHLSVEPAPLPATRPAELTAPSLPNGSTDVVSLVQLETARQSALLDDARRQLRYVQSLSDEGRHTEALRQLAPVGFGLPTNTRTLPLLQEIAATRVDLEHRQRVAGFNPGVEPPRLSLRKDDLAATAKSSDPLSKRQVTMELHMLELSGALIDDFWTAWRLFSQSEELRAPLRLHPLPIGRATSFYRPGLTPTRRQQELLKAFRQAAPRVFSSTPLSSKDRSLGFVAFLDAGAIVKVLSSMDGCHVLGSPTWSSYPEQGTELSLTPQPGLETFGSSAPVWQVRLSSRLADEGRSIVLKLRPRLTRYAGFVPTGGSAPGSGEMTLTSVNSTHEFDAQIQAPIDATLVMTGLEWQQAPFKAPPAGSPLHVPLFGEVWRARELLGERAELLVLLTTHLTNE